MWRRLLIGTAMVLGTGLGVVLVGLSPVPPQPSSVQGQQQGNAEQGVARGRGSKGIAKPPGVKKEEYKLLPTSDDFVKLAYADILRTSVYDRPFIRYIADKEANRLTMKTSSLTVNYLSRGTTIIRPPDIMGGFLIRVDLRVYAPRFEDMAEWIVLWENLAFDPSFALIITKDNLKFSGIKEVDLPKVRVKKKVITKSPPPTHWKVVVEKSGRWVYPDWTLQAGEIIRNCEAGEFTLKVAPGKVPPDWIATETIEIIEEEVSILEVNDTIRLNPGHIDPVIYASLQNATQSLAPVVDQRYFKFRTLNTIKTLNKDDDKTFNGRLFKAVFGGLYYEFVGIKKAKDVLGKDTKATDLDLFFENLGVGNIKAGLTADVLFDRLRSDQRSLKFRSGITGKSRIGEEIPTEAEKNGQGKGWITDDIGDEDIDIGDRQYANLIKPRIKAREAIFHKVTGLHKFALFNGEGARQDEVPPDVAINRLIPSPHTQRLQSAFDCIWCHQAAGDDGWKPFPNDAKKLLDGKGRLDIIADLGRANFIFDADTADRLAGLYAGDFTKNLRRARDDLAEATLKATGDWTIEDGGNGDQTDVVKLSAQRLVEERIKYWYDLVTPQTALEDLGLIVPKAEALKILRELLPPDERSRVFNYTLEDPRIGALLQDIPINRSDWSLAYPFAAERVSRNPTFQATRRTNQWLQNFKWN